MALPQGINFSNDFGDMMNTYKQLKNELLENARAHRIPIDVMFELTARCNLNCKMCYIHDLDHVKARENELSTEQWKRIFDDAYEGGMLYAALSGGECLLRNDFKELYLYLYQRGIHIRVNTNASLLTDDFVQFFRTYKPEVIQISLYGTNDEEYSLATGVSVFEKVAHAINALRESKINYKIAITPSLESKTFFKRIIDYCIEHQYPVQISQLFLSPRDEKNSAGNQLKIDEICEYLVYYSDAKGRKLKPISVDSLPQPGTCGEHLAEKVHCTAAQNRAHVDWKGIMHPCVAMPTVGRNLLEIDFQKAWSEICDEMDQISYPSECSNCVYKQVCKPCYAGRCVNGNWSECNRFTCELVRKKVSLGLLTLDV